MNLDRLIIVFSLLALLAGGVALAAGPIPVPTNWPDPGSGGNPCRVAGQYIPPDYSNTTSANWLTLTVDNMQGDYTRVWRNGQLTVTVVVTDYTSS